MGGGCPFFVRDHGAEFGIDLQRRTALGQVTSKFAGHLIIMHG